MLNVKEKNNMRKEKLWVILAQENKHSPDLIGGIMAIIRPAKDTMPTSITPDFRMPARTHYAAFWFISWIEIGRRYSLISSHLMLSVNIHDLKLLRSTCVI